jgi:hypothetical protein
VALLPTLTTFAVPPSELFAPNATEFIPVAVALVPSAVVFVIDNKLALAPEPALVPIATFPSPTIYVPEW